MYETLSDRSIIEVAGSDALTFLQNLTTNDMNQDYCYSYMLNNQGRYLFDFFAYRMSAELFLLDVAKANAEQLITKMRSYRLRARVEINDKSDIYGLIYSRQPYQGENLATGKDPRYSQMGFRSLVPTRAGYQKALGGGLYMEDKYSFAVPDGCDMVYERSIPLEFGARELGAISYSKGCYLGQEVISRVTYQGVVRKKILKIRAEVNLTDFEKNAIIRADDQILGKLCSSYKNTALALLTHPSPFFTEKQHSDEEQHFFINDRPVLVKISYPKWYSQTHTLPS